MKEFLKKMVSASGDVSHKRVIVVFFAFCIVVFCFIATYTAKVIPEFMFDALCLVVGGGMGLSVLDKFKSLKPKEEIVAQPQPTQQITQSQETITEPQEDNV
jgi:hypothetical protein